jgi:acyl-CoA hydrolase
MELTKRIKTPKTKPFKAIFRNTLNAHETLFGGTEMQWMNET